jgi:hypothetical protein
MAKIYIETNTEGEVISWATTRGNERETELEIEDGHPFFYRNPFFFKVVNGILAESEETKLKRRKERSDRNEIRDLKHLLAETDFYFIRKLDDNTPVPTDIQVKRQEARRRLRELGL